MNKLSLFCHLYREKTVQNAAVLALFSLLSAVASIVLFVQANDTLLLQGDDTAKLAEFFHVTENVLGLIATSSVLVGAAGGVFLIGFREYTSQKSLVIMHLFGMGWRDLLWKALLDSVIYALLATLTGYFGGYCLFLSFVRRMLEMDTALALLSAGAAGVMAKVLLLVFSAVFLGNLFADTWIYETPIVQILYARSAKKARRKSACFLVGLVIFIVMYARLVFRIKSELLTTAGTVLLILSSLLFFFFHLFFGKFTKKRRRTKKLQSTADLSFCFLCSRNKRDAMLAIVISAGTIMICIMANVWFNIGGMLRSAYQDNMGYTTLVRVYDYGQGEETKRKLDAEDIPYTYGYSKLMDYSALNGMGRTDGKFWALVIAGQTDENPHFKVAEHTMLTEGMFGTKCGLKTGETTAIFGSDVYCAGRLTDRQYLALMNYNFIVNQCDWQIGIDDTWHTVFLANVSRQEEQLLKERLRGISCSVETASGLIDEVKNILSDYFEIIVLAAAMIILATAAVFYTVIQSDMFSRRTELYLYRIAGASFGKAQRVIYGEYIMIALAAAAGVSMTVMICGEFYFYYGLGKHFWLSVPILGITIGAAVGFVFLCCLAAGFVNAKCTKAEVIRDE